MKYILVALGIFALSACTEKIPTASEADLEASAKAGADAARAALALPEGSMAQEGAIIAIRARETVLRDSGFTEQADTFAAAAEQVLAPSFK